VVLDRHAAVAMNLADQICGLNPTHSWEAEQKKQEAEDNDKDANGGGKVVSIGGLDEEKGGEGIDGVVVEQTEQPFLILPYSRASLKKPRDHFPKLHAMVSLKTPEEEQLVVNPKHAFTAIKEEDVQEERPKGSKGQGKTKHTVVGSRNHF
jgi:hypothetical protein